MVRMCLNSLRLYQKHPATVLYEKYDAVERASPVPEITMLREASRDFVNHFGGLPP